MGPAAVVTSTQEGRIKVKNLSLAGVTPSVFLQGKKLLSIEALQYISRPFISFRMVRHVFEKWSETQYELTKDIL